MSCLRAWLAALTLAGLLQAQQGGFISGVVRDRSGAVIVGAEVRVQNQQTGSRQKVYDDVSGVYSTSELAAGSYKVTVRSDGFRTSSRADIAVVAGKTSRIDFIIQLLPLQQEVTVTASQSHEDPMVSGVTVSRDTPAGSLPSNGRDVHALYSLLPGATVTPASLASGGQFTVGGQRPNANSFRVDGVSGNVGIGIISIPGAFPGGSLPGMTTIGGTQALASKEETERVELRSADFSAEYGDRPGAQIDIDTRSGANDFHGSAFGYIRPRVLDAGDWFARGAESNLPLPVPSVNGWGASLGGPLWRNHTYLFLSAERTDVHDSALQLIAVASRGARVAAGPAYQPILDAFPNPTGRALTADESVGYSPLQKAASVTNASGRLDQTIGSLIHLFGRFSYVPSASTSIELGTAYSTFKWRSATGGISLVTGKYTQEGRFNYSRVSANAAHGPFDTPALNQASTALLNLLLPPAPTDPFGPYAFSAFWNITQLSIAGMGQEIAGQSGQASQLQYQGSYLVNRHSAKQDLRAGADYIRLAPSYPVYSESLAITSPGIEALLAGVPLGLTNSYSTGPRLRTQHWSGFLQDTFHLTTRLDVLVGTRWEFTPSPYGAYNPGIYATSYPYVGNWNGINSDPVPVATSVTALKPNWPFRFNQIAPRLGVAYHLHRPDIVLRAGVGVFYDTQSASIIANQNPLSTWQYSPNSTTPDVYSQPPNASLPPSLYLPRVIEWRTTLEKSVGESAGLSVSYFGSAGRRLLRNEASVDTPTGVLQNIQFTNHGKSDYEALLAQYRGNISSRLYGIVSYTWSHSIDIGSSDTSPLLVQPGSNTVDARGSSGFDVRHLLTTSLGYRSSPHLNPLFRNWNISSTLLARAGFPFDVTTVDRSVGLGFDNSGRANLVPGQPLWIDTSAVPGGRELNPAAFATPASGQNGNLGRNVLTGEGLFQIDASLRRQFRLWRGVSTEANMSAFNLLNHPAFSNPVSYLGSALFGQSTSTANLMLGSGSPTTGLTPLYQAGGPRTIELGLRVTF